MSRQRRRWFAMEMDKRRPTFTIDKQLALFAGTWNVNGGGPDPAAEIHKWLFPTEHKSDPPFDVYMLGLQEIQQLTGVDAIRTDSAKGFQWQGRILRILGSDYEQVAERQLVGIMVMVFIRKNHLPYLSNVQLSYAATGFLNAGNKGGVAARFQLYDRTVSCVSCHLAAHTDYIDRRNQDFKDVVRKAVFLPVESPGHSQGTLPVAALNGTSDSFVQRRNTADLSVESGGSPWGIGTLPNPAGPGQWFENVASAAAAAFSDMREGANTAVLNDPNAMRILEHDAVFWLGDLNYRIDAPLRNVLDWIEQCNWQELYNADQLQKQMKICDVFHGFHEGPIHFAPTYKHHRFKDGYKCGENGETGRIPAYTDRILWRIGMGTKGVESYGKPRICLQQYASANVYSSDHRPVYASFEMTFGVEDVEKRRKEESSVNRELDLKEASFHPSLQFLPKYVDFGDVFFQQKLSRIVIIRNSGDTTALITVNAPSNELKWLQLDTAKWRNVEVPPGKSLQLQLMVQITAQNRSASEICQNGCKLDSDISVSIEPGRLEEKIRIRGKYVATTLGLSLEALSMLDNPVLALRDPGDPLKELNSRSRQKDTNFERGREPGVVPLSVPKEIWILVDALLRPNPDEPFMDTCPGIFVTSADEAATQRVLSLIDRGERIPHDVCGYAIGQCLLDVLRNLENSVIPRQLYSRVVEAGQTEEPEHVNGVIELLPPLNNNVFWYIIGFLCESVAVKGSDDGGREIAAIFSDVLLSDPVDITPRGHRYKKSFITCAFRIYKNWRKPADRALFDLSVPVAHPRRVMDEAGLR